MFQKGKRLSRQGVMSVGSSEDAKRVFGEQTQREQDPESAPNTGVGRSGTVLKYNNPSDILAAQSPTDGKSEAGVETAETTVGPSSPALSASSVVSPMTERTDTLSPMDESIFTTITSRSYADRPPSYMSTAPSTETYTQSPSPRLSRENSLSPQTTETSQTTQTTSGAKSTRSHAVRVKTRGSQLSSGFEYHPALYELKVHPEKWTEFTQEVVRATKLSSGDNKKSWAAATGLVLTVGEPVSSIYLKRVMDRTAQEKQVRAGIADMTPGSLGALIRDWNDEYFAAHGLFVHLELSESAMKNEDQKSRVFRRPSVMYVSKEDRERKGDQRKYVIVVTRLDEEGAPTEAIAEMEGNVGATGRAGMTRQGSGNAVVEMPGESVAELPGEDEAGMLEIPAADEERQLPPPAFAELEADGMEASAIDEKSAVEMDGVGQCVYEMAAEDAPPKEKEGGFAVTVDDKAAFEKEVA